jgi:hypothetical protein
MEDGAEAFQQANVAIGAVEVSQNSRLVVGLQWKKIIDDKME